MTTENTTSSILSVPHSLAGNVGPAAGVRVYYRGWLFFVFNLFLSRCIFTYLFPSCQPNFKKARCKPTPSHFRPFVEKFYLYSLGDYGGKHKIKVQRHFFHWGNTVHYQSELEA